jgi:nitrite reductase/ring-hydroxylating ferredoxin subunit
MEKANASAIVEPYYLHRTSFEAIGKLMRSGKGWGTYFLSFLFRSRRVPDVFDSAMGTFFVANNDADLDFGLKKLAEFRDSNEYITLASPDGKSTVSCRRFCPHQGADLKYATFDGRHVTCPRHQWRFDCENGGKADNSNDTIDATIEKKKIV